MARGCPVRIERGDPRNGVGLPRPIARACDGRPRPVPYTNSLGDGWAVLDTPRAVTCGRCSLCLICGEHVAKGFIIVAEKSAPVSAGYNDIAEWAVDGGPLHARCMKMTVAHCQRARNDLRTAVCYAVRYTDDREV